MADGRGRFRSALWPPPDSHGSPRPHGARPTAEECRRSHRRRPARPLVRIDPRVTQGHAAGREGAGDRARHLLGHVRRFVRQKTQAVLRLGSYAPSRKKMCWPLVKATAFTAWASWSASPSACTRTFWRLAPRPCSSRLRMALSSRCRRPMLHGCVVKGRRPHWAWTSLAARCMARFPAACWRAAGPKAPVRNADNRRRCRDALA